MKIDIYAGEDGISGEHLATFTVNGIDEIISSDLFKRNKENVTTPKVSLSFELTRSGLLNLNKAEAKVEETYWVEIPVPKPPKKPIKLAENKTDVNNDTSVSNSTNATAPENAEGEPANKTVEEQPATIEPPKPEKVQKKRSIPYPLNRIDRVYHGLPTLTREQI